MTREGASSRPWGPHEMAGSTHAAVRCKSNQTTHPGPFRHKPCLGAFPPVLGAFPPQALELPRCIDSLHLPKHLRWGGQRGNGGPGRWALDRPPGALQQPGLSPRPCLAIRLLRAPRRRQRKRARYAQLQPMLSCSGWWKEALHKRAQWGVPRALRERWSTHRFCRPGCGCVRWMREVGRVLGWGCVGGGGSPPHPPTHPPARPAPGPGPGTALGRRPRARPAPRRTAARTAGPNRRRRRRRGPAAAPPAGRGRAQTARGARRTTVGRGGSGYSGVGLASMGRVCERRSWLAPPKRSRGRVCERVEGEHSGTQCQARHTVVHDGGGGGGGGGG
jgi:hypothetical protein